MWYVHVYLVREVDECSVLYTSVLSMHIYYDEVGVYFVFINASTDMGIIMISCCKSLITFKYSNFHSKYIEIFSELIWSRKIMRTDILSTQNCRIDKIVLDLWNYEIIATKEFERA